MHRLIKIRIIRDFDRLEEQVRRGLDTLLEAHKTSVSFRPAADFYETTQGLVLRLELAGVAPEDVSLTLTGHELVVRGRRRPPPPEGIRRFVHLEMAFGIFERSFTLPHTRRPPEGGGPLCGWHPGSPSAPEGAPNPNNTGKIFAGR